MRHVWTAITTLIALVIAVVEIPALRKPKPVDPKDDDTYTAWWRWVLGIEPKHSRRFILVPIFTFLTLWFPPHVLVKFGPSLRFGQAVRDARR